MGKYKDQKVKALSWEDAISNDEFGGVWYSENNALFDARTLMSLFYNEDWVFITTDLLASQFAQPYVRVMKKSFVGDQVVYKPAENHPLQALLDDPSDYIDAAGFWYRAAVFYVLLGNTFIWRMKMNNKLFLLPAQDVSIEFDDRGLVKSYNWNKINNEGISNADSLVVFKPKEVMHVLRPNPNSAYWGLSPFVPGRRSILFNRYSEEFLNTYFERGATPQIVIETEIANNPEAIKNLAKSFEVAQGGRRNQRRPLVLPKGAKAQAINLSMADQKMIELINQNREVILNILRVPKHALSLQTAGSLGSEEHKTALRFMWSATIMPMLKRFSSCLTKFFKADLGEDYIIDFDTSEVEVATEDLHKRADLAQRMLSTHTLNEVRQIVWESQPIEGGDVVFQLASLNAGGTGYREPMPADYTPPADANPANTSTPALETEAPADKGLDEFIVKMAQSEKLKAHTKTVDEELALKEDPMTKLATELLAKQAEIAVRLLVKEKKKADGKDEFDAEKFQDELDESFEALRSEWSKGYVETLKTTIDVGFKTQLDLVFSKTDQEAIANYAERNSASDASAAANRARKTFANISETSSNQIVATVQEGLKAGNTVNQIANDIVDKGISPARAKLIARTEVLTAVSIGQKKAMEATAQVVPEAEKVWLSSEDDRVRKTHGDSGLHGKQIPINEDFEPKPGVKLSVPRDPKAKDASEVCNCRCTVAIVVP